MAAEIPVCAPLPHPSGSTLATTDAGIHVALFPRTGGRCPDELDLDGYAQLGRLLGRIHNVAASLSLPDRPELSPATYGMASLATLQAGDFLAASVRTDYAAAVQRLVHETEALAAGVDTFVVHADCHRGNLLRGRTGFFFLDFDDMARGPAVQDLWLLLPARPGDCVAELAAMLDGYSQFREFPRQSLGLIEGLRGLRYVRYAAWIARRWDDPAFRRAFPGWGEEAYWQRQLVDLYDQLRQLQAQSQAQIFS